MEVVKLDAVVIPAGAGFTILVTTAERSGRLDDALVQLESLPVGWYGRPASAGSRPAITYAADSLETGLFPLSFYEFRRYLWILKAEVPDADPTSVAIDSSLRGKATWVDRTTNGTRNGEFLVSNYLGAAWICLAGGERIRFNILSSKLDSEGEYRSMVETIASSCHQLLLEWGAPTTLSFACDPDRDRRTLLEQFLFLRSMFGRDGLDFQLEMLRRHPHNVLCTEGAWKPFGTGDPFLYLSDPSRAGRFWTARGGHPTPAELLECRKYESLDTQPNRFVKFALESFRQVCEEVVDVLGGEDAAATAMVEAAQLRDELDSILAAPFFAEIGALRRVPFDNQALQKREGYRQILTTWLMLDAAAQLDWPGRDGAYDGTNRDVAVLYEYWLFFVLYNLLRDGLGMELIDEGISPSDEVPRFFECEPSGLRINLKRGHPSVSVFSYKRQNGTPLRIHLYYNRHFGRPVSDDAVLFGSYSRGLRPDFTLIILSEPYTAGGRGVRQSEKTAELDGRIAYLHFDAKFRIDRFNDLSGQESPETSGDSDTYKVDDLNKMHTYNDAIRQTIGSYVIYPGEDSTACTFKKYHDILPGVGAFAIRPDPENDEPEGLSNLKSFLSHVLGILQDGFSELSRLNYWTHQAIKETPSKYSSTRIAPNAVTPPKDTIVLLGFVRDAETGMLMRSKNIFYFHAVGSDGITRKIDQKIFSATHLVPYTSFHGLGWYSKIKGAKLVSKAELSALTGNVHSALYYYLLELAEIFDMEQIDLKAVVSRRPGHPVLKTWDELYKSEILVNFPGNTSAGSGHSH